MKPHKHADLIKAWADGAEIQWYDDTPKEHRWKDCPEWFIWNERYDFRIKPEPKPDFVDLHYVEWRGEGTWFRKDLLSNLKLTFDGETGKLKSAEVL